MPRRVTFPTQLPSEWSINMVKVLVLRINQCFGPFTMSRIEESYQTGAFRRFSNHVFQVGNFGNTEAMRINFFRKCLKFNVDLENGEKSWQKIFRFWDKFIWIVCIELPLGVREYLSLAVNLLTKIIKTFHVTKGNFSNSITFEVINQYGKGAGVKIESVFWPVYHVACRGVLSNGSF